MKDEMKYSIILSNISKKYQKKKKKILVLNNLNYRFKKGCMYCIFGKSGIGKTTLLEIMGTLIDKDNGKILICEKDIDNLNSDQKSELRNKKIGFIFQSYLLIPSLTVLENVLLPSCKSDNDSINKAKKILDGLDILERQNHYPKELSGGEQQRVAIARAVMNNPEIILADEPTGSLDSENAHRILKILKELSNRGKCVILVSHDDKVQKYADVILSLTKNGLVFHDKKEGI